METKSNTKSLDLLFRPKNVLIFEAKAKIAFFIEGFIRQGFDLEKLYLVSPKEDEILGIKCYKSIDDVPADTIDLMILSIRREIVVQNLNEVLSKKKINFIHIFTAGTAESDEVGLKIERDLKEILMNYPDTRGIGPNCMGLYCPRGKVAYYSSFPIESGNISLIFQSGDLHSKMVKFSSRRYDLRFSKGVSIGNCIDIQVSELLQYFNDDDETDLICVYFEGLSTLHKNEGNRLLKAFKDTKKPILFMRGGRTERGQKAVLTHTGSMASKHKIWEAIFNQTAIIEISPSLDELIDYAYLFSNYIKRFKNLSKTVVYPSGKRALVVLWSGGFGILATDTLTELGLELPLFEGEKLEKLKKIYPIKIGSLSNPFDMPWVTADKVFLDVCKVAIDDEIDLIVVETDAWRDLNDVRFKGYYNNLYGIKTYAESLEKVFIIILHQYPSESRILFHDKLVKDGFLVYTSIESAAKSFLNLYKYGQKRERLFGKIN